MGKNMIFTQIKSILLQAASDTKSLWNQISVYFGFIGGFFVWFFGGWDSLIAALIALMVIDYISGLIKAIYLKKLSSGVGFRGLIKKFLILIVVGSAVVLQGIFLDGVPLREITIMFFICNEGISILENAAMLIPIPKKLKDTLLQLRDSDDIKKQ